MFGVENKEPSGPSGNKESLQQTNIIDFAVIVPEQDYINRRVNFCQ